jgi:endonuclease/exonuclease/phosphatase family metal-dependent hydrolase
MEELNQVWEILKVRHSPNIPLNKVSRCVDETSKKLKINKKYVLNYLLRALHSNYSGTVPSVWLLGKTEEEEIIEDNQYGLNDFTDVKIDTFLQRFISDCQRHSILNQLIPEHHGGLQTKSNPNIIRFTSFNIHNWFEPTYKKIVRGRMLSVIAQLNPDVLGLQEIMLPVPDDDLKNVTLRNKMEGYGSPFQSLSSSKISEIQHRTVKTDLEIDSKYTKELTTPLGSSSGGIDDAFHDFTNLGYSYRSQCMASVTHSGQDTYFGNLLVSKYPVENIIGVSLKGYYQGRCMAVAEIIFPLPSERDPKGVNQKMIVCTVHLDVFDFTGKTRLIEIQEVIAFLKKFNEPIILMGDLNALRYQDYTDDERQWLARNNQGYPLDFDVVKELEAHGYQDVFRNFKYSTWTGRRVDYIFTKNFPYKIVGTYVYYTSVSDHLPVIMDIDLSTRGVD